MTRTAAGSTLTPIGQAFAAWARDVVAAAGTLSGNVTSLRVSQSAKLRIAASLTNAEYLMPRWLLVLRRENPSLDVSAVVANSHDVCDRVRSGAADLGFVEMPAVPADLSHADIGADTLTVVAAPDYPAARASRPLTPTDLLEQPLLLREIGSGTRDTFLAALATALGRDTVAPAHAVELGSTSTILATARAGGGLGVLSARAAGTDIEHGNLVEVPVAGLAAARPLSAVWMGATPSPSAALLIEVARR
ncbi:hypothetical protein GCM10027265_11160 [Jatrophihabitans fulvus]